MEEAPSERGSSLASAVHTRNREVARLIEYATGVASTPYSVLIEGETGTGKDVFARGIHAASQRAGPFVPLNCSAVPETMFEAELFGARRGAYTGLDNDRPGLFLVADSGTLFLDEVADLPASMQAKLLRVLEDGVIRPIGGATSVRVDVRVIAATHKPLKPLVDTGRFRSDLFFRLSATCLNLPPIRDRPEDIGPLLDDALADACDLQRVPLRTFSTEALDVLTRYPWPGNVRELNNVVAAAVLSSSTNVIDVDALPVFVRVHGSVSSPERGHLPFYEAFAVFERAYITNLLRRADGNLSQAARLSGLSRGTVRNKARRHGLLPSSPRTKKPHAPRRSPAKTYTSPGS